MNSKSLNTEILGVSVDSIHSHKAWINTPKNDNGLGKLNFPLASDITKKVASDYGVLIEEEGIALARPVHHRSRRRIEISSG